MKKSRKEFIIKGHAAACSEWKANIEKEFPKLFVKDELEVGKWYKTPHNQHLMYFKSFSDNGVNGNGYGINVVGVWFDYIEGINMDGVVIATDKEVETALIKEAKKRGFKKGNFRYLDNDEMPTSLSIEGFCFDSSKNCLWGGGSKESSRQYLFHKGKWATIIETITKEQAEKELGKTIID